jgi:hypothetical protein
MSNHGGRNQETLRASIAAKSKRQPLRLGLKSALAIPVVLQGLEFQRAVSDRRPSPGPGIPGHQAGRSTGSYRRRSEASSR